MHAAITWGPAALLLWATIFLISWEAGLILLCLSTLAALLVLVLTPES